MSIFVRVFIFPISKVVPHFIFCCYFYLELNQVAGVPMQAVR